MCVSWIIECLIIIDARCKHDWYGLLFWCGELASGICVCLLDTLCLCLCFGMSDLNMLACVASTGQPSVAVECLECLRVHVRGWRPAFGWGLSLSSRHVCPYCSAAAAFFMLATRPCCFAVSPNGNFRSIFTKQRPFYSVDAVLLPQHHSTSNTLSSRGNLMSDISVSHLTPNSFLPNI